MKKRVKCIIRSIFFASLLIVSGCTIVPRQGTVELIPVARLGAQKSKPVSIFISEVRDNRIFQLNAEAPEVSSLATVQSLDDVTIAKAVAQIRAANRKVYMDLLLERGTVTEVVKDAVEEAFRRAGYEVLPETNTDAGGVTPVEVSVNRFWGYNTGSWTFEFYFEIDLVIEAEIDGLKEGKRFSDRFNLSSAVAATPRSYRNTISKGLEHFVKETSASLP